LASIKINPDINIDRVKLFLYTLYLNACPSKIKRILSGDTGLDNIQELPATVEVT
jgi:hypothetical protein